MGFLQEASNYLAMGLSPIPLRPNSKAPWLNDWSQYCKRRPTMEELQAWSQLSDDLNIGICTGIPINEDEVIGALDIDHEEFIEPVLRALGSRRPAKKGNKGLTVFIRAPKTLKSQKLKRRKEDVPPGEPNNPVVEILLDGNQTVMPPSSYPVDKLNDKLRKQAEKDGTEFTPVEPFNYHWVGAAISNHDVLNLPRMSMECYDELQAITKGQCSHFKNLNEMTWLGVDGGGDTHDTCVAAVAALVARDWSDEAIQARVQRAKREAVEAAGDSYHWPEAEKVIQGWIDSAREKGYTGTANTSDSRNKVPLERVMATWGVQDMGGASQLATVNGILRRYQSGHWPKVRIEDLMFNMYAAEPTIKEREVKAAVNIIHVLTSKDNFGRTPGVKAPEDPKKQRICLANGTLDTKEHKLLPHAEDHDLLFQLNFKWDPEATCPVYDKFMIETFNGDQKAIDCFEEFAGLTLVDDMSYQKMLFLQGPGSNGKGTLARILSAMHDPNAIGSVGITDLNDERKRSSLVGKLVNISGEQTRLNKVSDTYLKKITGGDPIDVRALFKELQNNVYLSVRFVELVNEMPSTSDTSHAFKRRLIILECPNIIKTEDQDLTLDSKLWLERPGILKRWVVALRRLRERGQFDPPEYTERLIEDYMEDGDPVRVWIKERTRLPLNGEKSDAGSKLYENYVEWTKLNGYKFRFNFKNWGKRLAELGYPPKTVRVKEAVYKARDMKLIEPGVY